MSKELHKARKRALELQKTIASTYITAKIMGDDKDKCCKLEELRAENELLRQTLDEVACMCPTWMRATFPIGSIYYKVRSVLDSL